MAKIKTTTEMGLEYALKIKIALGDDKLEQYINARFPHISEQHRKNFIEKVNRIHKTDKPIQEQEKARQNPNDLFEDPNEKWLKKSKHIDSIRKNAALIKAGKRLTLLEEKLCIENFKEFSELLTLDDLRRYFKLNEGKAEGQFEKIMYDHWKKVDIILPKPENIIAPEQRNVNQIEKSNIQFKPQVQISHNTKLHVASANQKSWIDHLHNTKFLMGLVLIIFSFIIAANFHSQLTPASVSVSGYNRSDGIYIQPYNRRPPNSVEHDKPDELGTIFFGFLGIVGCAMVAIKLYSYRE